MPRRKRVHDAVGSGDSSGSSWSRSSTTVRRDVSFFLLTTVDISGKAKREGTGGHQVCGVGRREARPRQVITCQEALGWEGPGSTVWGKYLIEALFGLILKIPPSY